MKMLHCRFWFSDQSVLNIEWWDEQRGGVGWGGTVWRRFETRSDKHDLIMRCRVAASLGAFFATLQLLGAPFNIILN